MFLEFFAAVALAFAAGGIAMLAQRLTGGRLPGWIVPAAAGLSMLGYVIWSEYSWAGRVAAALPPGVEVASQNSVTSWYRPWTWVAPLSNRLIAVDHRMTLRHPDHPDLVMTGLVLRERWALSFGFRVLFDCAQGRRADLTAGMQLTEDGVPEGVEWFTLAPDDPVLRVACRDGAGGAA